MQRTFSGFPSGWSGVALLVLRLVVGGSINAAAAMVISTAHGVVSAAAVMAGLVFVPGSALILGLMTPLASALVCLTGVVVTVTPPLGGHVPLFESGMARLELIAMSLALVALGPGALSFDARLYGRRELRMNGHG